ncbi:MAG TPA: hypothetical protein DD490_15805, partial [Acidobacteria bacterium]|nr:hypothetical protein [Acidobacteriota bacterium]
PLSRSQALGRLGHLLLHNGDLTHAGAEEHFRAALAAAPGDATALAGLGRITLDAGRRAEALSLFTQAAQAAPEDFFLHYLLGANLLQPEPAPGDLPRAEAALRRAIALRPDFAEAWGRLAEALTHEETLPADAARIFETAWRMMPSRLDFAFNLTVFYARTGATGRAEEMIAKVLLPRRDRPDLAMKAREAVFLGRWEGIERDLVTPGRLEDAVPRLADLLAQAPTPERREALQKRLDEIREAVDYNGFAGRYNRAVDFLNAGRDDEAIRLLEELVATTKNPGQAAQARELLDRVLDGPRRRP